MRRGLLILTLTAGLAGWLAARPPAKDAPEIQIKSIKNVGREGAGNADAAAAWKALVAHGPSALVPILRGMEDDSPVSANWLRPAIDAIAEKALADKAIPTAELRKFIDDTKNGRAARRLAYEWLVKADPKAADDYLPRMLKDPSPELRRDAVARALDEADALAGKMDAAAAKAAYQKALTGAIDPDQVDAIAAALDKLGEKVDVAKHLGCVTVWHVAAPFDHRKGIGWNVAYPPEKGVDLNATYTGQDGKKVGWVPAVSKHKHGTVDLDKALKPAGVEKWKPYKGAVGYAYAVIDSPKEQDVELRAGSIVALKMFLNGKEVFAHEEYHHGARVDQYVARGKLRKGRNDILLKVCQNEQKESYAQVWFYMLRLTDHSGSAVPFTQAEPKEAK